MRLKTESKFKFLLKWQTLLAVAIFLLLFTVSVISILAAQAELSYSGDFSEMIANDGAVSGSRIITLEVDTFSNPITLGVDLDVTNVPVGLTAVITRNDDLQLTLTLTGNATDHLSIDDVNNLTIDFLATAFVTETNIALVVNATDAIGIVDFENQASLVYAGEFTEAATNDGSVADSSIIVTLTGDTFNDSASVLVLDTDFTVSNVPTGLTANNMMVGGGGSVATLTFTGQATNHLDANDIADLTITFLDHAFDIEDAANVTDYIKDDIVVDFNAQPYVTYSGGFIETAANDGSVTGSRVATLTGDVFINAGANLTLMTDCWIDGISGMSGGVLVSADGSTATLNYTGNATNHLDADDISNLMISFNASAFANTLSLADVVNPSDANGVMDFLPAEITYSGSFTETAANDGGVDGSIEATLSEGTFIAPGPLAGSDFTVGNLPDSLLAVMTVSADSLVAILTLTGNADSHLDADDISNLTITFLDPAFSSGDASTVENSTDTTGQIDFNDPAEITYSGVFTEANTNDGSLNGSIEATLTGGTFIAPGPLAGSDFTVGNLPASLSAVMTVSADSLVATLTLTGNADSHLDTDDISNLTITFLDPAFSSGNASDVVNYTDVTGVIDFIPSEIIYAGNFTEITANDGTVEGSRTATLSGETFIPLGGTLDFGADYAIPNIPEGLNSVMSINGDGSVATLTFINKALGHLNAQDVSDLTIIFYDSAFSLGDASIVTNSTDATGQIDFDDQPVIIYSGVFTEAAANDGSLVGSSITAALSDDTFVTDLTGKVTVGNVPAGLSAVVTRNSATLVTVTLTGNADSHTNADDVSDLEITFLNGAFFNTTIAMNVDNYTDLSREIDFIPSEITYDGIFTEIVANDGTVGGSRTATLSGDTFKNAGSTLDIHTHYTLSPAIEFIASNMAVSGDGSVATLTFTGKALVHANVNDVSDLTITFLTDAFNIAAVYTDVVNYTTATRQIDFDDQPLLSYSDHFAETIANDGTVAGNRDIHLTSDTFQVDLTGKVAVTNVPGGLSAVVTRIDDDDITVTLTGAATNHLGANSISDLTITFSDGSFVNTALAENVDNYTENTGQINFADAPTLSYLGDFTEIDANDGAVEVSRGITLALDTFVNPITLDTHLEVDNIPAGLVANIERIGDQQLTLTLTGNAVSHANANDISNLTIEFLDGAFTNTVAASDVINYIDTAGGVDFNNQASLAYSGNFAETDVNNGVLTGSRIINLVSDTFVSPITLTTHLDVTNVPAGLTAVITRDNNTQLTLTLTGTATSHVNVNDISNLAITFKNGAFTNTSIASNVSNYTNATGVIDFKDASGGSISLPVPSTGGGELSSFVDMETESNMVVIDENSRNFLLYINSLINFQVEGDSINSYTAKIQNLDMLTGEIEVSFNNGQVISLFVNDLKQIDLNGDSNADISVAYNELKVNRIDLTLTKVFGGMFVGEMGENELVLVFGDDEDLNEPGFEGEKMIASFAAGDLLKEVGRSVVYLLENGKRRAILNEAIFRFYGFSWDNVKERSDFSEYPIGEYLTFADMNIHDFIDGDLVKEANKVEVYILENGKRRHILDESVFHMNEFNWSSVYEVADLSIYSLGEIIDALLENQIDPVVSAVFEQNLEMFMRNDDVKRLQVLLARDSDIYPEGISSGYFGFPTKVAVAKFQMKYDLVQSSVDMAYGRVDEATRAKLLEVFWE